MTAVGCRKKRWLKVFGLACLVITVVALALPVWFPWVLRPVLAHFGVRFDAYERVGYTQFALTNVRGDSLNARVRCGRIVGFLPPRWLWRLYSHGSEDGSFLTVAHWSVQIEPSARLQQEGPPTPSGSALAVADAMSGALPAWRTWLPEAQLTDGRVEFDSNRVVVAAGNWSRGRVTVTVEPSKPRETFILHGDKIGRASCRERVLLGV